MYRFQRYTDLSAFSHNFVCLLSDTFGVAHVVLLLQSTTVEAMQDLCARKALAFDESALQEIFQR